MKFPEGRYHTFRLSPLSLWAGAWLLGLLHSEEQGQVVKGKVKCGAREVESEIPQRLTWAGGGPHALLLLFFHFLLVFLFLLLFFFLFFSFCFLDFWVPLALPWPSL